MVERERVRAPACRRCRRRRPGRADDLRLVAMCASDLGADRWWPVTGVDEDDTSCALWSLHRAPFYAQKEVDWPPPTQFPASATRPPTCGSPLPATARRSAAQRRKPPRKWGEVARRCAHRPDHTGRTPLMPTGSHAGRFPSPWRRRAVLFVEHQCRCTSAAAKLRAQRGALTPTSTRPHTTTHGGSQHGRTHSSFLRTETCASPDNARRPPAWTYP